MIEKEMLTYIPYHENDGILYAWDEDIPYILVRGKGNTKYHNILIMHDGDVLRGHHHQFENVDIIICCHPQAVREITGDSRIAYEFGNKPVHMTVGLYNAVTEMDEIEIYTRSDQEEANEEDLSYFKLIAAGLK